MIDWCKLIVKFEYTSQAYFHQNLREFSDMKSAEWVTLGSIRPPYHACSLSVICNGWNKNFFLRRYNFREVLAFSTNSFHLGRFLMQSLQFVIFIFVISLFTSSSKLFLGLPSDLVSVGDHSYTFFTMLLSGIRCTCQNQASLCALM